MLSPNFNVITLTYIELKKIVRANVSTIHPITLHYYLKK